MCTIPTVPSSIPYARTLCSGRMPPKLIFDFKSSVRSANTHVPSRVLYACRSIPRRESTTTYSPSGENETEVTSRLDCNTANSPPASWSQSTVPSAPKSAVTQAIRLPFLDKAATRRLCCLPSDPRISAMSRRRLHGMHQRSTRPEVVTVIKVSSVSPNAAAKKLPYVDVDPSKSGKTLKRFMWMSNDKVSRTCPVEESLLITQSHRPV